MRTYIFFILSLLFYPNFSWAENRCQNIYKFSVADEIEYKNLEELVVILPGGKFKALTLNSDAITVTEYSDIKSVLNHFKLVPLTQRRVFSQLTKDRLSLFSKISDKIHNIALVTKSKISYRTKDSESVKMKVIDRVEKFKKAGRHYQISDLSDLVGFRVIVDRQSKVLSMTSKEEWASLLDLSPIQILEVDIKGNSRDFQNGKKYRAIHLNIQLDQATFEVQIMSEPMSIWHKWDHGHVYKNTGENKTRIRQLKNYSDYWATLIYLRDEKFLGLSLSRYYQLLSLEFRLPQFQSLRELNNLLLQRLDLDDKYGFSADELNALEISLH